MLLHSSLPALLLQHNRLHQTPSAKVESEDYCKQHVWLWSFVSKEMENTKRIVKAQRTKEMEAKVKAKIMRLHQAPSAKVESEDYYKQHDFGYGVLFKKNGKYKTYC